MPPIEVPVWLILVVGVACFLFWMKAFDFGARGRVRWACFVFAVVLMIVVCAGILGNITGVTN